MLPLKVHRTGLLRLLPFAGLVLAQISCDEIPTCERFCWYRKQEGWQPNCVSFSNSNPIWILEPPLSWYYQEYGGYVDFWIYNVAANRKSWCRTSSSDGSGSCVAERFGYGWEKELTTGNFTLDTTENWSKSKKRTLTITQTWDCNLGYEPSAKWSGTAVLELIPQTTPWNCTSMGREGEMYCYYNMPHTFTPQVTMLSA